MDRVESPNGGFRSASVAKYQVHGRDQRAAQSGERILLEC